MKQTSGFRSNFQNNLRAYASELLDGLGVPEEDVKQIKDNDSRANSQAFQELLKYDSTGKTMRQKWPLMPPLLLSRDDEELEDKRMFWSPIIEKVSALSMFRFSSVNCQSVR